jgi:hypothetical protein
MSDDHNWNFPHDLNEAAWVLIANAWNGNWDNAPWDWQVAAARWRDAWLEHRQPTPASPSPRALDQAPAAAREAASLASEPNRPVKPPGTGERGSCMT